MRILRSALLLCSFLAGFAQADSSDALAIAVMNDDVKQMQAALAAGADINASLGEGRTPLISAVMMTKPAAVKFLLEHGADPKHVAQEPAGNALAAAFFATNGVALTRMGEDNDTLALRPAALEILRLIAARKPDFNVLLSRGPTRMSPLMIAANAGVPDVVKILLDAGASPNFANGGKYTALDYAVDRRPGWSPSTLEDRAEVVRLLIAAGAQPQKKGADGLTAMDRAKRSGNPGVIAALSK
jgi:ankyrin repeat protein